MENNGMTLDDLHNQDDDQVKDLNNQDINDDDKSKLLKDDLEEDGDEGEGEGEDDKSKNNDNKEDDDSSALTGLEKWLTSYGIEGGIVTFEDQTRKHFNDLTQEEQFNVLKSIAESGKTSVEEEYNLDPEEIGLINHIRNSRKSVQEALNDLVQAELLKIETNKVDFSTDFVNLPKDTIYLKWLKNSDPEASESDLQESLEIAKKTKTYDKQVESIRQSFIQEQEREIELENAKIEQENLKELEADREMIVNVVSDINDVAGWSITPEQKNEVLGSLLEVNSHGDSLFMEKVFSDPKKLFEVAWLEKYGNEYFDKMSEYFRNEISKAYARGKKEGVSGLSSKPITTGTASNNENKTKIDPEKREHNNALTLDQLHED